MMAPSLLNCIVEEAYSSPLLHGKVALIREVASLEGGQFISILLSQHLKSGLIRGVVFGRSGIIRWVASLKGGQFISILLSQHLKSGLISGVVFGRSGIIRWVVYLERGGTIY